MTDVSPAASTALDETAVFPQARTCPFQPPESYDYLRDGTPLHRITLYSGKPAWLVTRLAEARQLLADPRLSADRRRPGYPIVSARMEGLSETPPAFNGMDPPEHSAHRRMLIPDFGVKRMRSLRPEVERIVNGFIDRMLTQQPPMDLVEEFALPVPATVICELLGVPYEDHGFFENESRQLVQATTSEESREAAGKLTVYLSGLIARQRDGEGAGLLGRLAVEQLDNGALRHEELVRMALLLLVAGHETTASMISLSVAALLENPDQLEILRADPNGLPIAVEELLRFLSTTDIGGMRVAVEDIEIAGLTIRAGEGVLVSNTLVNRDASAFPEPDRLDVRRPEARQHLAFSYGVHQCLGHNLARMELEVALAALFERIPTLRLAVPVDTLPLGGAGAIQGVNELPVAW